MTLKFTIAADAPEAAAVPSIVVGIHEDRALTPAALRIDERSGGAIRRLVESGDATGKAGSTTVLFGVGGIAAPRVVLTGLGEQKKLDAAAFHRAAVESARALKGLPIDRAVSYLTEVEVPGRDAA
jgi:leucyl aminopeptidase